MEGGDKKKIVATERNVKQLEREREKEKEERWKMKEVGKRETS